MVVRTKTATISLSPKSRSRSLMREIRPWGWAKHKFGNNSVSVNFTKKVYITKVLDHSSANLF